MKRKINLEELADLGACQEDMRKFARMWPKGAYITVKNVALADKAGLDIMWLLQNALSTAQYSRYSERDDKLWMNWYLGDSMQYSEYEKAHFDLIVRMLQNHWHPRKVLP